MDDASKVGLINYDHLVASILNLEDALYAYTLALSVSYNDNIYDVMSPEMTAHYMKCMQLLHEVKTWELCPDVLQKAKKKGTEHAS
jgi:hypothetical protein